MSIFDTMNRKQKREFEKLPKEERMQIFTAELNGKISECLENEIPKAFYRGYLQAFKFLAEKYMVPLADATTADSVKETMDNLLDEIRRNYDLYAAEVKKAAQEEKKEK